MRRRLERLAVGILLGLGAAGLAVGAQAVDPRSVLVLGNSNCLLAKQLRRLHEDCQRKLPAEPVDESTLDCRSSLPACMPRPICLFAVRCYRCAGLSGHVSRSAAPAAPRNWLSNHANITSSPSGAIVS